MTFPTRVVFAATMFRVPGRPTRPRQCTEFNRRSVLAGRPRTHPSCGSRAARWCGPGSRRCRPRQPPGQQRVDERLVLRQRERRDAPRVQVGRRGQAEVGAVHVQVPRRPRTRAAKRRRAGAGCSDQSSTTTVPATASAPVPPAAAGRPASRPARWSRRRSWPATARPGPPGLAPQHLGEAGRPGHPDVAGGDLQRARARRRRCRRCTRRGPGRRGPRGAAAPGAQRRPGARPGRPAAAAARRGRARRHRRR